MQLASPQSPPARQNGASHEAGHKFAPDQSLHVFRNDKVLLNLGEYVGQVGERSNQVRASSSRRSLSKQMGRLPDRLDASDSFGGEIMRADQQRIVMKRLRAGRSIVRIVQTDQGVTLERG